MQPGPACGPLVGQGILAAMVIGPFHALLKNNRWLRAGTISEDPAVLVCEPPPESRCFSARQPLRVEPLPISPFPGPPLLRRGPRAPRWLGISGRGWTGVTGDSERGQKAPTSAALGFSTADSDQQSGWSGQVGGGSGGWNSPSQPGVGATDALRSSPIPRPLSSCL